MESCVINSIYKILSSPKPKAAAVLFALAVCSVWGEELQKVSHNPWELIIYRPENSAQINEERCWLTLRDDKGSEIKVSAQNYPNGISATYEWISNPDVINRYERSIYLSGGMAMHLHLQPGKYTITFSTPKEKQFNKTINAKENWTSNEFIYNTENAAKVIFVTPTANENGFYTGGWHISAKAPEFFKVAKPKRK